MQRKHGSWQGLLLALVAGVVLLRSATDLEELRAG